MVLKRKGSVTAGQRQKVYISKSSLWKGDPEKSLVEGIRSSGGRNSLGRVTVRARGSMHRRKYRKIDFNRSSFTRGVVQRIEYDPNRTALIALVKCVDTDGLSYIICPKGLKEGDTVSSGEVGSQIQVGNAMPLKYIPAGIFVHNIELKPGKGAQLVRSAGTCARLMNKSGGLAMVKLPSGEVRYVSSDCSAVVGEVSNADIKNIKLGKAGATRWLGRRSKVRGVAMNPIDHPHGGGEGKTSGGRHPVTPWGKPTKGKKTRNNSRTDKWRVSSRHAKR
uniref:50S ribosomal protein L2 n=1 Tax=Candidatus Cyrtobacter comes TaxID=675776 RepID=UPI003977D741